MTGNRGAQSVSSRTDVPTPTLRRSPRIAKEEHQASTGDAGAASEEPRGASLSLAEPR